MPLRDVDTALGRFQQTCIACGLTRKGLKLGRDLVVAPGEDAATERARLLVICVCGASETFFDHGPEHEDESQPHVHAYHAQQTRLIRQAKRHLGAPVREHVEVPNHNGQVPDIPDKRQA
jgi:hypothetical protein